VKYNQENEENSNKKPFFSVKQIFEDHWKEYLQTHHVRAIEKEEVSKMLSCKGMERGCFVYYCRNCDKDVIIPFGCNSRLCSSCGKRHTDRWAETLSRRAFPGIIHRHLVFTIPEALWIYVKEDRNLQKVIMDASYAAVEELFSGMKHQHLTPGVIAVLHPFGKDLRFKPHVHCIVTEGGFHAHQFVSIGQYIHYDTIHKVWQYHLLTALRGRIPQEIIDGMFKKYPHGFCSYVKPERIHSNKRLAQYLGRYVRHPAINNSRIMGYDRESVTFFYRDHEKSIQYKTFSVHEFISAVIQHLPEKQFRLVRYYGVYSRKKIKGFRAVQSTAHQTTLMKFTMKRAAYCPYCDEEMEFVAYVKKPPPKDLSKLNAWMDLP
jgi:hypothetical protein